MEASETTPRSRLSDEVLVDMSQLMEEVRQDVLALMQEGLQKTASFCAHQCAKRVLAARREMHQRLQEQKREFERAHGVKVGSIGTTARASTSTSTFPSLTPRLAEACPPRMPEGCSQGVTSTPRSLYTPRSMTRVTPQLTPRISRTNGAAALDPALAHDVYIDAHLAVQELEDKTRQATRAMHLIEEAIKVTTTEADVMTDDFPSSRSANTGVGGARLARPEIARLDLRLGGQRKSTEVKEFEEAVLKTDAVLLQESVAGPAGTPPQWHTPRGTTPTGGNTPPHLCRTPDGMRLHHAANALLREVPVDSEVHQVSSETLRNPMISTAMHSHGDINASVAERRRRDLSVGSVISNAESAYSVKGSNLHGY